MHPAFRLVKRRFFFCFMPEISPEEHAPFSLRPIPPADGPFGSVSEAAYKEAAGARIFKPKDPKPSVSA